MKPRLVAAPVITVLFVALSACSSGDTTANENDTSASSVEPSVTGEPSTPDEPTTSPGYISRPKKEQGTRDTIGGVVSWEAPKGYGATAQQARTLGALADAFLVDHYLREDRYVGEFLIKPGEMDAFRAKVSPQLAESVQAAVTWFDEHSDELAPKTGKPPKSLEKTANEYAHQLAHLYLNTDTVEGGKGEGRFEFLSRSVFKASTELGWKKPNLGKLITYSEIATRHVNNSGTGKRLGVYQVWEKADGGWRIFDAGVRYDDA